MNSINYIPNFDEFLNERALFTQPKKVIGNPYGVGDLLVAEFDFKYPMNWEEATHYCSVLGDGWRLPTKQEYERVLSGNVKNWKRINKYWTSTEYSVLHAYSYDLQRKSTFGETKDTWNSVRAVKDNE
jgi:hypothetical protein